MKKYILAVVALSLILTACNDSKKSENTKKSTTEISATVTTETAEEPTAPETPSLPQIDFSTAVFEKTAVELPLDSVYNRSELSGNYIIPVAIYGNDLLLVWYDDTENSTHLIRYRTDKGNIWKSNDMQSGVETPFAVLSNNIAFFAEKSYSDGEFVNEYFFFENDINVFAPLTETEHIPFTGMHSLSPVNDTQFIDFSFITHNSTAGYDLEYSVNLFDIENGKHTEIISETIEVETETTMLLAQIKGNDNKVYVRFSEGSKSSKALIQIYNLDGEIIDEINLDLKPNASSYINDFNIFGDFISIDYGEFAKSLLLQKNGDKYDVVAERIKFLKPTYSENPDKYIFYTRDKINSDNPRAYHSNVYLYDNGKITGLVDADMTWLIANDEKLIYCSPDGVCYSVDLT